MIVGRFQGGKIIRVLRRGGGRKIGKKGVGMRGQGDKGTRGQGDKETRRQGDEEFKSRG
jgi:hypothetical protein